MYVNPLTAKILTTEALFKKLVELQVNHTQMWTKEQVRRLQNNPDTRHIFNILDHLPGYEFIRDSLQPHFPTTDVGRHLLDFKAASDSLKRDPTIAYLKNSNGRNHRARILHPSLNLALQPIDPANLRLLNLI
jgi:hypothetical protein